jgi:Domain of unknown function (DUF1707)
MPDEWSPYSVSVTGEVGPSGRGDDVSSPGELRASHEDRDRVAELLRVAAGEGRLTAEELDQRLEKALTARTLGELAALSRDLPAGQGLAADALAAVPKEVIRIERQGGRTRREGRWLVPQRIEVKVGWGRVALDFTEAVITQPLLQIDADVRNGALTLLTMPGIDVDADDVVVRSSGSVKIRAPRGPQAPVVLRIKISGTLETGRITARPRRRSFSQRLRRQPGYRALPPP